MFVYVYVLQRGISKGTLEENEFIAINIDDTIDVSHYIEIVDHPTNIDEIEYKKCT